MTMFRNSELVNPRSISMMTTPNTIAKFLSAIKQSSGTDFT
jgi:hypothetical protein